MYSELWIQKLWLVQRNCLFFKTHIKDNFICAYLGSQRIQACCWTDADWMNSFAAHSCAKRRTTFFWSLLPLPSGCTHWSEEGGDCRIAKSRIHFKHRIGRIFTKRNFSVNMLLQENHQDQDVETWLGKYEGKTCPIQDLICYVERKLKQAHIQYE